MNTPQPGWYDDPEDSKAQRYWDGQNWTPNRRPKPISQPPPPTGLPAQPAPPPPGLPPSPYQQAPSPLPRGGPPQKSRTPTVIAAIVGAVAVLAVIGWLASPDTSSPPNTGNQGSPNTGNQGSSNSGHTASYNTGYWWAYHNKGLYIAWGDYTNFHDFCAGRAKSEAPVQGLNTAEWIQGCEDSFHKMGIGEH